MPDNEQFWKEIMNDKWLGTDFDEGGEAEEIDRAIEGKSLGWEMIDDELSVEYIDAVASGDTGRLKKPEEFASPDPILNELFSKDGEKAEIEADTQPVPVRYISFDKSEKTEAAEEVTEDIPEQKAVEEIPNEAHEAETEKAAEPAKAADVEKIDEKTLLFRELGPRPFEIPMEKGAYAKERREKPVKTQQTVARRRNTESDLPEELVGPSDFEVDFDYEEEYQDVNEKPIKRGRGKRTGCLGGILYFIFILAVSVTLACLGWMAATDVLGLGMENEVVEITIPKSIFSEEEREKEDENGDPIMKTVTVADMDYVADILYESELIEYKWIFKLFCVLAKGDEKIDAGTYQVNKNYDYRALLSGMTSTSGTKVEIDITVPEGYTVTQIIKLLVDNGVCDEAELWDVVANNDFDYDFLSKDTLGDKYRLEGYLFPDTYTFYIGDNPVRVIKKFLSNFKNKWTEEFAAQAESLGYTREEILIIASMIEKEAGIDAERATIASVIYNRLKTDKTGHLLQIDATIVYAMSRDGASGEINTEYNSVYNTYQNKGLPPGPIANPGIASIKAALYPENTKYYYYALNKEGSHEFFKDYESHTAFVRSEEYGG